jgi:predicted PurR-regulated permease PerM
LARSSPEPAPSSLEGYTYRVLIAVGLIALAVLGWRLANVFILVFGGILVAVALRVLTDILVRHTRLNEQWALVIVVLSVAALLACTVWLIGAQVASQLGELIGTLPKAVAKIQAWLEQSTIGKAIANFAQSPTKNSEGGTVSGLARFAGGTFSAIADTVVILFVGLYLALDPGLYRRGAVRLFPKAAQPSVLSALEKSGTALRKWLVGQLSAMVAVGTLTFLGLALLQVPLSLSLALIAALLEFVPFAGPIAASIPAILMGFTQGPQEALYVSLLYLAINQVEGNVIMPLVQKWAVALPPALGILSVVAFAALFGIAGVLFAVPLMVVAMTLVQELYIKRAGI